MSAKRITTVIIVITVIAVVFCCIAVAAKPVYVDKVLISTPLYTQPDFNSGTLFDEIKQGETVEILSEDEIVVDGKNWIKISYLGQEGYILSSYTYKSAGADDYDLQVVKATGKTSTEVINVYEYYSEDSKIVGTLVDGEKVNLVLGDKYGENDNFCKIIYDGEYRFVKAENITDGLTYNQRLAVIITVSLVSGLLVLGVVIVVLIQKKKRKAQNK